MKTYQKPNAKVIEIRIESQLMESSLIGEGGPGEGAGSNSRRGGWGSLWNKEDEE